ncbi:MAG: FecCD family ABC transporter permease [Hydrogeniiclostridium sp.]
MREHRIEEAAKISQAIKPPIENEKRERNTHRMHFIWTVAILAAILVLSAVAVTMGRYHIGFKEFFAALVPGAFSGVEVPEAARNVIFNIRLPRIGLALLAGAGLSVSGGAFQALFSNPLATPDTLGVATGASFGAVLGILLGLPSILVQTFALLAGLLAVILVYTVGRVKGGSPMIMLILAGMVISALFSALVSLVKYTADPQDVLPAVTFWLMGSLSGTTNETLLVGAPFILLGMLLIYILRWKLNAMTLSEEEATSLGIPVKRIRALVVLGSTMITASVVSMCGLIGWVGLLIPHIARMIFGNNNTYVVPASMGLGAIFMLVIDTAARCVTAAEIPVSILTAVIGAPFFIALLRKTGGIQV